MTVPRWVRAQELRQWWLAKADGEVGPTLSKMVEYGGDGRATDLVAIGRELAQMMENWDISTITDGEATEIGIAFYVRGKVARVMSAIKEGSLPSEDTWIDIGVYARMALRAREKGGWPE